MIFCFDAVAEKPPLALHNLLTRLIDRVMHVA